MTQPNMKVAVTESDNLILAPVHAVTVMNDQKMIIHGFY